MTTDAGSLQGVPVALLALGNQACGWDVNRVLSKVGCRVDPWRDGETLDSRLAGLPGILVLAIGRLGRRRGHPLRPHLERIRRHPVLGLFASDPAQWDPRLLDCCSEFTTWPCSEPELRVRLDRLWGRHLLQPGSGAETAAACSLLGLNLIGHSPAFLAALDRARRFAGCDVPVLIQGETGTGKELLARAVHYFGERREYPFVPVNCGALPETLVENELFGHERGAYTNAAGRHPGLVAQAEGGTLFLDEVEALSPRAQVTLLRFLQEQEYRPLGATESRRADVRVIAATNESLVALARERAFREDLMFRLDVMRVEVPPLRERADDVISLAEHFLQSYRELYDQPRKRFHPDTPAWLRGQDWPGNVRELENLIHREFLLCDGSELRLGSDGPDPEPGEAGADCVPAQSDFRSAKARAIASFECRYLRDLMAKAGGNVSRAARIAGKERRTLGKLLKKYGIDRNRFVD